MPGLWLQFVDINIIIIIIVVIVVCYYLSVVCCRLSAVVAAVVVLCVCLIVSLLVSLRASAFWALTLGGCSWVGSLVASVVDCWWAQRNFVVREPESGAETVSFETPLLAKRVIGHKTPKR